MKLNNKGFAITAVLYGLLILFVILVSSYLLVLSARKDRIDDLVNDIENSYKSELESQLLTEYIKKLYLNNKNKIVENGPTNSKIQYQYAESVNLMNDRLGGTTEGYDDGNVRYYGANPNNYIDIGDRTSTGEIIPYRIIGLFKNMELANGTTKDLVKVIRADSIGDYSWDNKTSGIGSAMRNDSNDWTDARLMMLLNPGYDKDIYGNVYSSTNPLLDVDGNILYGYEGSLWWNSKSGTCYSDYGNATKSCDFTSSGLSADVQSKIEEVVWNLGGTNPTQDIYSNSYYETERGEEVYTDRPTKWTGRIALMYPSDYGYGTDFNSCTTTPYYYDVSGCYDKDWLFNNANQWNLTPYLYNSLEVHLVLSSGRVQELGTAPIGVVRPVFYLDSELVIESGDGTTERPYVIK